MHNQQNIKFLISIAPVPAVEPIDFSVKRITGGRKAEVGAAMERPAQEYLELYAHSIVCPHGMTTLFLPTRRHISDDSIRYILHG
jgi:hypothetical protein